MNDLRTKFAWLQGPSYLDQFEILQADHVVQEKRNTGRNLDFTWL